MKLNNLILCAGAVLALASCSNKDNDGTYTVTVPLTGLDMNGKTVYLSNYDTREKIDSVTVENDTARFTGTATKAFMANLIYDGRTLREFIVEKGDITFDTVNYWASGTPLNESFGKILSRLTEIEKEARSLPRDSSAMETYTKLETEYDSIVAASVEANKANPIGYYFFAGNLYNMDSEELGEQLKKYPEFKDTEAVKRRQETLQKIAETSAGKQYKDFTVKYNGADQKLSDYVGKDGKYTLVDFWASWCGPCMREIETLKKLNKEYGSKMNVVGVAVWDEPENTLDAIARKEISWPCIIDAQRIPTDIYGIAGIPCIILIDPQGKILVRDKMGEELEQAVKEALAPAAE